jgi:hypothetical protein
MSVSRTVHVARDSTNSAVSRYAVTGRVLPSRPRPDLTVSVSIAELTTAPAGMELVSNARRDRRSHSGTVLKRVNRIDPLSLVVA